MDCSVLILSIYEKGHKYIVACSSSGDTYYLIGLQLFSFRLLLLQLLNLLQFLKEEESQNCMRVVYQGAGSSDSPWFLRPWCIYLPYANSSVSSPSHFSHCQWELLLCFPVFVKPVSKHPLAPSLSLDHESEGKQQHNKNYWVHLI